MQSDVLPFTMYDSMDYMTVGSTPPPQGFVHRDAPQVQSRSPEPREMPAMLHQPPAQGATGGGGGQAVKQKKQEDIDLEDYMDYGSDKNDISNYHITSDLVYIIIAVLVVDVAVIILTRFFPEVFGVILNKWYNQFGLNAVIADVGIIVIGFLIGRYIYTAYVKEKFAEDKWSPLWFTGTMVVTQLVHDLAFYFGIIKQVPSGANAMIDVFKAYGESGGAKILFGDALMVVGSVLLAMGLKPLPMHAVAAIGSVATYLVPYFLYQNVPGVGR
jgi:hypothetical protein